MTVAHQFMGQLSRDLQDATLANARSKVVFQTSADDARLFAREFGRAVEDHDLMHLGPYEVILRLATSDGVSAPVTGVTQPPSRVAGLANEARRLYLHSRGYTFGDFLVGSPRLRRSLIARRANSRPSVQIIRCFLHPNSGQGRAELRQHSRRLPPVVVR